VRFYIFGSCIFASTIAKSSSLPGWWPTAKLFCRMF